MNAIDFYYDGQYLSDYGFIICDFDGTSGVDTISAGSTLTFNKVAEYDGKQHVLTSTKYDDCITTTFDICKNPELYDDLEITNDEVRDMMRWLNRREFLKFQVYDEDLDIDTCYYEASFNIEKIKIREIVYGLRLTMETNRPFAYGQEQNYKLIFTDNTVVKTINDMSDEIGVTFPYMKITCQASGNLSIHNDLFDCTTTIKGCTSGEVITIDNSAQIITTSISAHKVYNDFNYEFFRIGNTFLNRQNNITVTLPCIIEIKYDPIIKDVP